MYVQPLSYMVAREGVPLRTVKQKVKTRLHMYYSYYSRKTYVEDLTDTLGFVCFLGEMFPIVQVKMTWVVVPNTPAF